jgi:PleD family two-component response regulator
MERVMDRSGQSAFLMLCTILDGSGKPMKEGAVLTRLAERLGESIAVSIRRSDVACRYGKGQFLILLLNTTVENCDIVEKRINKAFSSEGQRTKVSYHVNVVTYEPFDE